ncbi:hypothetical protein NUSPORA_01591 [Nucleospora cyclopteri]
MKNIKKRFWFLNLEKYMKNAIKTNLTTEIAPFLNQTEFLEMKETKIDVFYDELIFEKDEIKIYNIRKETNSMLSTFNNKLKRNSTIKIIGHRGDGSNHYNKLNKQAFFEENTYESFLSANKKGCEMIEFDVQLSKENIPIIFHDNLFEINGVLYEVCKLSAHHFFSLSELFEKAPEELHFNIEIKNNLIISQPNHTNKKQLVLKILEVVKNAKYRRIMFSSFDLEICLFLKILAPEYNILYIIDQETIKGYEKFYRNNTINNEININVFTSLIKKILNELDGIVFDSAILKHVEKILEHVDIENKMIYFYGELTNDKIKRQTLLEKYTGIITDNL